MYQKSVYILNGLGSPDGVNPELIDFFGSKGFGNIYGVKRGGDRLLSREGGFRELMSFITEQVGLSLDKKGSSDTYLFGISFGSYLAFRMKQRFSTERLKVIGVNPVLNPQQSIGGRNRSLDGSIQLLNGRTIRIHEDNLQHMSSIEKIPIGSLLIGASNDEIEPPVHPDIQIINDANHTNLLTHPSTQKILETYIANH